MCLASDLWNCSINERKDITLKMFLGWCKNIFHHHQPAVFQILPSSLYPFRFWTRLTPLFILYFNQKSNLQRINFLHTPFNDSNIRINSNKSLKHSLNSFLYQSIPLAYSIYSRNNTTFPSRLPSSIQFNLRTHTFCQCYPFWHAASNMGNLFPKNEAAFIVNVWRVNGRIQTVHAWSSWTLMHPQLEPASCHMLLASAYTIYWLGVKGYQHRSCDSLCGFAEDRISGAFSWSIIFLHATI